MKLYPDFEELLRAFDVAGASFLVVGGYAVAFHGQPRATKDLDLWVSGDAGNLARVAQALHEFGAPSEIIRHAAVLGTDEIIYFGQPPVRVDILTSVEGLDYAAALVRSSETVWGGAHVRVVGLEDLLTNKRAVGRERDLMDVRALEKAMAKRQRPKG
jgi:hypothetical protein